MNDTIRGFLGGVLTLLFGVGRFGAAPAQAADAPRITAEELRRLVSKREAVVVDVRSQAAWDLSHIEGALHIPLQELPSRLRELPKDKLIACYCT